MATKIEWTQETWNPITGCTPFSKGCDNCYAKKMAIRLKAMKIPKYQNGFEVTCHKEALKLNFTTKNRLVFVCSMSDLFHEDVPFGFIDQVIAVVERHPDTIFQILTKRVRRMEYYFKHINVPTNTWIGVTVEDKAYLNRLDILRQINAKRRFVSFEPLLGDLGEIDLTYIGWVIVGGESGNKARPMQKEWIENIHRQCQKADIPFFFKQWGAYGEDGVKRSKKRNGSLLNGHQYKAFIA